jgi:ubiquinone/menaquinone biosynthesis C-methylase UbiE
MPRTPEPELMCGEDQAYAYSWANFTELHPVMVARFCQCYPDFRRGRMLDLGCGTADMTMRFAQAYPDAELLGVDGSTSMLAYGAKAVAAAGLERRIVLEKRLLPDATLERGEFDAVISNSLLHHVADPVAFWRSAARCARPAAPVVSMDLRRPATEETARELVERYAQRAMPVLKQDFFQSLCAAYRVEEIEEQLRTAGLKGFRVEAIGDCQVLILGNVPGSPFGAA